MRVFDRTTGQETWITPEWVVRSLGKFDLDPCAADDMPYRTATRMVTKSEDGLKLDWGQDRVWLNPPYGREIGKWLEKMNRGIALLPARTDARWFHELVAPRFHSILFVKGRIRFLARDWKVKPNMRPAFGNMLVAYTMKDTACIIRSGICGLLVSGESMQEEFGEDE